jgi:hypothetical protein
VASLGTPLDRREKENCRSCSGTSVGVPSRCKSLCQGAIMDTKRIVVVTLVCLMFSLGACRREVPYAPMKLGGAVSTVDQPAR